MKKKYLAFIICSSFCIFNFSQKIFAQTTTIIDYNPTPTAPILCDIFKNSRIIGGLTHNTTLGQPIYSTSQNAIGLNCLVNSNLNNFSTSYKIAFPFKAGYNYKIRVNAYYSSNTNTQPTLRVQMNSSNVIGASDCVGPEQATSFTAVIPDGQDLQITNTGTFPYADYDFYSIPTITADKSFLNLIAYNLATFPTSKIVFIKKITILETPPPPMPISFNLTPTILTLQKGTSTTQTFTVTNVNNTPSVTGYIWNIGATPNGWIYNGSPAPATINTSGNSLTLSSVACANTVNNISASATIGTTNYSTNICAVNVIPISYNILPISNICANSTTNVFVNAPNTSSVNWIINNAPLGVTVTPTGNPAIITVPLGINAGSFTLTASVVSPCGDIISTPQISIFIGLPNFGATYKDGISSGNPVAIYFPSQGTNNIFNNVCREYGDYYIDATPYGTSSVNWSVPTSLPYNGSLSWSQTNSSRVNFYFTTGTAYLQGSVSNVCGSNSQIFAFKSTRCLPIGTDPCAKAASDFSIFNISPNPAK